MSRNFTYTPSATGKRYHEVPTGAYLFKCIRGVPGSGKSIINVWDMRFDAEKQPPILDARTGRRVRWTRWGFFRKTFQALNKTTIPDWLSWFPEGEITTMHWSSPIKGLMEVPSLHNDGTMVRMELEFYATDANTFLDDLDGLSLSGAYINEAAAVDLSKIIKIQERVGRFKPPGAAAQGWKGLAFGVKMDTNTPTDSTWWYDLEQIKKPKDWIFFVQPPAMIRTRDASGKVIYLRNDEVNSKKYGTPGPAENIEHLEEGWWYYEKNLGVADEDYIKRRLLNEYGKVKAGEPVWPEFSDSIHTTDEPLEHFRGAPTLIGVDTGRHPAAAICQLSKMGQFRMLGEETASGMSFPQFVDELLIPRLVRDFNWPMTPAVAFIDPAGLNKGEMSDLTALEYMVSRGIQTSKPEGLKNNDPQVRINSVASLLRSNYKGVPSFIMARGCRVCREGMNGGYCYKRLRAADGYEKYDSKPDKNNPFSHICDALQYVVVGALGGSVNYSAPASSLGVATVAAPPPQSWNFDFLA